jgi:hypothetical protein
MDSHRSTAPMGCGCAGKKGKCQLRQSGTLKDRHVKKPWLVLFIILALLAILLFAVSCGEEEGREARATADELAEDAGEFAEGFCTGGTAMPAMFILAALVIRSRRR